MEEKRLLLAYDLQFFAGDDAGEKTEEPTSKKLGDARKKGQVAKSRELVMAAQLMASFILLRVYVGTMGQKFSEYFYYTFESLIPEFVRANRRGPSVEAVWQVLTYFYLQILLVIAPFLVVAFLVGFVSNIVQFKWQIATEPLKPKLSKLNPMSGVKKLFSKQSLVELLKSIVKIAIIFIVAYVTLAGQVKNLFLLYDISLNQAVAYIGTTIIDVGFRISVVYFILSFADLAYQKWHFKKEMKMTKQEVKDEYKNAEGDPQIKGKIKQKMREASVRRIQQALQRADVVITNPEHLAVALEYDREGGAEAPKVTAKGADYAAKRIRELAKENNVPIVQNKGLARALYTNCDEGDFIPPELYEAVAEILAEIYKLM